MRMQLLLLFFWLFVNFAQSIKVVKKSNGTKIDDKNTKSGSKIGKKLNKANLVKTESEPPTGESDGGESPEKREWLQIWDDNFVLIFRFFFQFFFIFFF